MDIFSKIKGRGSSDNRSGRFESQKVVEDYSDFGYLDDDDLPKIKTEFIPDSSKTIVTKNNSPDICFTYSMNPYRGCEHGCAYCYARPTHEYLGYSAGLDFESKILVKKEAPNLLKNHLMSKSWKGEAIFMSGVTDCYQPAERKFRLTRQLLEVLNDFKNPVGLITKNHLILRDLDILSEMAKEDRVHVCISVTSLDSKLARTLEPRTSAPMARIKAIEELSKAGVPVTVNMAPIIPGLTDHEIPSLLKAVADAGALSASYTPVRLPFSVKDHFAAWLEKHHPEKKGKVLRAIADIREGSLNDAQFGSRMRGWGKRADHIENSFSIFRKKFGLDKESPPLNLSLFQKPGDQLSLL